VDEAEVEEPLARAINADAVEAMANHARAARALIVHYSTDYVFDGSKEVPYIEQDRPSPLSAYGRTKLEGERALEASGCDYICLRTSWVYASRGRNFFKTMLKLGREREELRVVSDQIGTPTTARLLADITAQVILAAQRERARGEFRSELVHAVPTGWTSWYGFATAIFDLARTVSPSTVATKRIIPIPSADYPTRAKRPLNSRLGCNRLTQRFNVFLPNWETGLNLCMQELA
jgi:dTDP-4-dehydrorhamnose reductase